MIPPIIHENALLVAVREKSLIFEMDGRRVEVSKRDLYYQWPETQIPGDLYEIEVDGWGDEADTIRLAGGRSWRGYDDDQRRKDREGTTPPRRRGEIVGVIPAASTMLNDLSLLLVKKD